jgi:tRNA uridine 5-carboxymethylaminomethyl modification enzyme
LTPYGRKLGLITDLAWQEFERKQERAQQLARLLAARKVDLAKLQLELPELAEGLGNVAGQTYAQLLKRPEVGLETLMPILEKEWDADSPLAFFCGVKNARVRNEIKSVETEIKFAGYLDQQRKTIEKLKRSEQRAIPRDFEYRGMSGLSREMQETLSRVRPQTLGQASRIPGVTPAALSLLQVHLEVADRVASL